MTSHSLNRPNLLTVSFIVAVSASFAVYRNSEESRAALAASDRAFDAGDLKRSLLEARFSAMSAVQKTASFRQALERLSAIAVGSESAARPKTALLARMSLFSVAQSRAVKVDPSFGQQSDEQLRFLVEKIAPATSMQSPRQGVSVLTLALTSSPAPAAVGLVLIALATAALFGSKAGARQFRAKSIVWLAPLLVSSAWFIGWFVG